MRQLARVLCVLAGAAALGAPAAAEKFGAHVYDVDTGDTIVVKLQRKPVKIHLWGIAAPVKSKPYTAQSKKYLSDLIRGKDVIVDVKSAQKNGDIVAKILWTRPSGNKPPAPPPSVDVGRDIVSAGLAWWNPAVAPAAKDLKDAQDLAKKAKKGLWADPHPIAPWTYGKPAEKPSVKPPVKHPVGPKR